MLLLIERLNGTSIGKMAEIIKHKHLIIRAETGKTPTDPKWLHSWLVKLVQEIKMDICQGPITAYVNIPGNKGLTGVVIIETSHIAVHIWDEVDPGLLQTGYGLIKIIGEKKEIIDYGTISPNAKARLSERLLTIFEDLIAIIDQYKPTTMAIEEVFYGKNVKSALLLGHARGVSMVCASKYNIPVFEYSARKVKQSITGNGNAHKTQIKFMIMREFNLKSFNAPIDASDALAIALCHLHQIKIEEL